MNKINRYVVKKRSSFFEEYVWADRFSFHNELIIFWRNDTMVASYPNTSTVKLYR